MQTLRDYQTRAADHILSSTTRRLLVVSPVGSGKTTILTEVIRQLGVPTLFVAHRKELIDQASARLDQFGIPHGVIMASHPRWRPMEPVQVASVQTLRNRAKPAAELLIFDEAHRAKAATWEEVSAAYPAARTLGFTASPWRLDGKALLDVFEESYVVTTARELVAAGFLTPVTGFSYDSPDLKRIRKRQGEYDEGQLAEVMGANPIMGNIVERWRPYRQLSTVVFAVNISHSRELCERFKQAGARAEHIDAGVPRAEREAILARVASGETEVICNVNILTEGTDIPRLKLAILARPTLSLALYIQMQGRIRRPWGDIAVSRIHDHAGCVLTHGLPDADRDYSLTAGSSGSSGYNLDSLRSCPECWTIWDPAVSGPGCPACGYVKPMREVLEAAGVEIAFEDIREPVELKPAAKAIEPLPDIGTQRMLYSRFLAIAKSKGYREGWAAYQFRAKFGGWPTWEVKQ